MAGGLIQPADGIHPSGLLPLDQLSRRPVERAFFSIERVHGTSWCGGGGGGDSLNYYIVIVLDQAKALWRYWPDTEEGRLFQ